ncbi:prepilin-type N-terminal cleavage/methylation domain-containing protein [Amphibacillus sp. MSJ-3]|uniref:competence type IV pilus major pilin ComGC n=1 Tax=Amphibacillus sp. MSJ-3 TaxID=2841505 RepID=UPI001C0F00F8|nr:competence type IV pilus major pilin ComGC [Amphibacillus sp. MSJ-3]MBU5594777.1 prepilin-type N-terminal cleavage/methylation domain-containing protein [Amphibacillus sp. MSJ-3]
MLKDERAFTLIEMLLVLAVISLLLILIVPNLADKNEEVHNKGEEALIQMAESQVQAYYIDNGKYPTSVRQLVNENYLSTDELANGTKRLVFKDNHSYKVIIEHVD